MGDRVSKELWLAKAGGVPFCYLLSDMEPGYQSATWIVSLFAAVRGATDFEGVSLMPKPREDLAKPVDPEKMEREIKKGFYQINAHDDETVGFHGRLEEDWTLPARRKIARSQRTPKPSRQEPD